MRRCQHTEAAIDDIYSTRERTLSHCPACGSRLVQAVPHSDGWCLWKCLTCTWEANIFAGKGKRDARDIVELERHIVALLRPARLRDDGVELMTMRNGHPVTRNGHAVRNRRAGG
jgi:hypothetical protein